MDNVFRNEEILDQSDTVFHHVTRGKVHDFESNLIRRLAGLLYISDVKCGNAKKKALAKIQNANFVHFLRFFVHFLSG